MKTSGLVKNIFAAICLALCIILPSFLPQNVNQMISPMHIPVLLCGFACGWQLGALVGFTAPLLRLLMLGMPPIVFALPMAFELAVYGAVTGLMYMLLPRRPVSIYAALIAAMIAGRVAGGLVTAQLFSQNLFGVVGSPMYGGAEAYSVNAFLTAYFGAAVPGIVLHIVIVPTLVLALERAKVLPARAR